MTDLVEAVIAELTNSELAPEVASQVVSVLGEAFGPGSAGASLLAVSEAVSLQQRAVEKLRVIDRQQHHAAFVAVLTDAETARQDAEAEAETLTEATAVTLGALRHAQDQHQGAADYHRECAAAVDDAAMIGDAPAAQVELILARDAAQQVLQQFADAVTRAERDHAQAVNVAEVSWGRVKVAKQAEVDARNALADAEAHPEDAPRSELTLYLGLSDAITNFKSLSRSEQSLVRGLIAMQAEVTGADQAVRAEARRIGFEQGQKAAREEARRAVSTMPPKGPQVIQAPRMM